MTLSTILFGLTLALTPQQTVGGGQGVGAISSPPIISFGGSDGHFAKRSFSIVADPNAWEKSWMEIHGLKERPWGKNEPPQVDFTKYLAVVVGNGPGWNSWGIEFVEAIRGDGKLVVRFDRRSYQTAGPGGGGVRCNDWGVCVIERYRPNSMFPDPKLILEENVQNLIGGKPIWKVRAEFDLK